MHFPRPRPLLALALAALALSGLALAQQGPPAAPPAPDFSKVEIKTTDLGDGIYMLEGQGGNITVATAKDGIIMVDSEFAPLHDKIKAAIATISPLPVKYLINTHFHGDHTGGNAPFAKDGAIIVSEVNVKTRLAAGTTNGLTGVKTPPAAPEALPAKTYTGRYKIRMPGRVADLIELGELMCIDALHRRESCGGHFRAESQTEDGEALRHDDEFAYVAAWEFTGGERPTDMGAPVLHKEDLVYEFVEMKQRSYK